MPTSYKTKGQSMIEPVTDAMLSPKWPVGSINTNYASATS